MEFTRESMVSVIREFIINSDLYLAAWEGGSAAYDYDDELSDLDLGIVCNDDDIEEAFASLYKMLDDTFHITKEVRIPEPAWHGYSQSFYFLEKVPPMVYVDFVAVKKSLPNNLTQSDRHGQAKIWFDPLNLIDTSSINLKSVTSQSTLNFSKSICSCFNYFPLNNCFFSTKLT